MNVGNSVGTRMAIGLGVAAAALAVHTVVTEIGSDVDDLTERTMSDFDRTADRALNVQYETSRTETLRSRGRRRTDHYFLTGMARGADRNADGQLDRPELRAVVARYDRNEDGRVSGAELRRFREDQRPGAPGTGLIAGTGYLVPAASTAATLHAWPAMPTAATQGVAGASLSGGTGTPLVPSLAPSPSLTGALPAPAISTMPATWPLPQAASWKYGSQVVIPSYQPGS